MKSELIVDVQPADISIALLEDGRLMSLQREARNVKYAVGDVYYGKVKKLMPGLNAAFVDIGSEKDAFLHYLDLGSQFSSFNSFVQGAIEDTSKVPQLSKFKCLPDIDKQGSISDILTVGQRVVVAHPENLAGAEEDHRGVGKIVEAAPAAAASVRTILDKQDGVELKLHGILRQAVFAQVNQGGLRVEGLHAQAAVAFADGLQV